MTYVRMTWKMTWSRLTSYYCRTFYFLKLYSYVYFYDSKYNKFHSNDLHVTLFHIFLILIYTRYSTVHKIDFCNYSNDATKQLKCPRLKCIIILHIMKLRKHLQTKLKVKSKQQISRTNS